MTPTEPVPLPLTDEDEPPLAAGPVVDDLLLHALREIAKTAEIPTATMRRLDTSTLPPNNYEHFTVAPGRHNLGTELIRVIAQRQPQHDDGGTQGGNSSITAPPVALVTLTEGLRA
jgi:hypothetical protein